MQLVRTDLRNAITSNIHSKYELLRHRPRIPFYISDFKEFEIHCKTSQEHELAQDSYIMTKVMLSEDDSVDDDVDVKCPICGCATSDNTFCIWLCCGVIACIACILAHYSCQCSAVCPWCGSLASNFDELTEMIVPVTKPLSCLISSSALENLKMEKGIQKYYETITNWTTK